MQQKEEKICNLLAGRGTACCLVVVGRWGPAVTLRNIDPPKLSISAQKGKNIVDTMRYISLGPKNYSARGTNKIWRYLDI
jgi:hypothetical protein